MKTDNNRNFFLIALLGFGILAFIVVQPYFNIVLLALITVIIFQPIYNFFFKLFKNNTFFATILSVISVLLCLIIPLFIIGEITVTQLRTFYDDIKNLVAGQNVTLEIVLNKINSFLSVAKLDMTITEENVISAVKNTLESTVSFATGQVTNIFNLGVSGFKALAQFFIYIIILAGLFPTSHRLLSYIKKISPLDSQIDNLYIKRATEMAKSMVKGTFIIALIQGIITGIVVALLGVPYPFFWGLLAVVFSIVPLGAGIVNVPIALFLLLSGQIWQGIVLILVQVLIIGNIDNIIRPKLVSEEAHLHPLLILLSVLGGMSVFGFWGLIYGPVIMILFVTSLEVYLEYYRS